MFRIGDVTLASNLLLCPIAGYCDLAFRLAVRPLGGLGLACTDLVNPRGLLRQTWKSMELVMTDPGDRPLCVQLYGREPDMMAEAARWCVEHVGASIIDLNMGCPVDKVCKKDAGSALMRRPGVALRLVRTLVRAVDVPVTVKMRLGWSPGECIAPEFAAMFEQEGVAAVTVHGRTASQRFRGQCDRDGIARVVEAVERLPVIGNGDVKSPQDAARMLAETGCAAVMIGRAALADPWIFRDTHAYLTTGEVPAPPTLEQRLALMERHFENLVRFRGERIACVVFRQRVSWYARRLGRSRWLQERMRGIAGRSDFEAVMAWFRAHAATPLDEPVPPPGPSRRQRALA